MLEFAIAPKNTIAVSMSPEIHFVGTRLFFNAFNASKITQCKNDGNSDLLHFLFKNQSKWVKGNNVEDANKNLKKLLKDGDYNLNFDKCTSDKNIEDHVLNDRISGSKKFNIQATPTLIINDKKFDNPNNYKKLKKTLEKLI